MISTLTIDIKIFLLKTQNLNINIINDKIVMDMLINQKTYYT